jgi:hypothetical protein
LQNRLTQGLIDSARTLNWDEFSGGIKNIQFNTQLEGLLNALTCNCWRIDRICLNDYVITNPNQNFALNFYKLFKPKAKFTTGIENSKNDASVT